MIPLLMPQLIDVARHHIGRRQTKGLGPSTHANALMVRTQGRALGIRIVSQALKHLLRALLGQALSGVRLLLVKIRVQIEIGGWA